MNEIITVTGQFFNSQMLLPVLGATTESDGGILHALLSNALIALFAILALGMALGAIKVKGLNLGSSGVLFVALVFGHYGYTIPAGLGSFGLVLFVYCVGISAGSRFFSSFRRQGATVAKLSIIVVGSGALAAYLLGVMFDLPRELAVGMFAGALTSTPALAAALDSIPELSSQVSVGYSIAYPFGVIGVVLFVQLLPRMLKKDLQQEADRLDAAEPFSARIVPVLVKVTNANLEGRLISETDFINAATCQISRRLEGQRLFPLKYEDKFHVGQHLLLIGDETKLSLVIDFLGEKSDLQVFMDADRERQTLVLTSRDFIGRSLNGLNLLKEYGIVISRITRHEFTFVPTGVTVLEANDQLTVVGEQASIKKFASAIGHRSQAVNETDILSLACGITLGIIVGLMPIALPGGPSMTLGLAGGPLLVALVLSHFGRIGRIAGYIPRPSRVLMMEMGLVLFLADAGIKGGGTFMDTVQSYGVSLFLIGAIVTIIPMMLSFLVAYKFFKMNLLQTLGGICGGMTSTPALGTIASKTDSQTPVVAYASAYPVALIFMTISAKLIIELLA